MGGGQFKQALNQIIEAEKQPIKNLQTRKTREEAKLKLFQEFKSKFAGVEKTLADFTNFKKFREFKVDLGDGANLMNVTIDKEVAEPGTYRIELEQLAERTSIISNGFENPDEKVLGIGFVVAETESGDDIELFVDEDRCSLRGVAQLINRANTKIRASVVKDDADPEKPWRIIITAKDSGTEGKVTFPEFYFLDGLEDFYIADEHESQNALLSIDGFEIEASNNEIKDFLQGVNVQLKQARPDAPFTMTISEDHQKISGKVKGLIDQVNGILEFINKQNQVDEKSDTRTTFAGDTALQNIEYRLRNLMHEGFPATDPESPDGYRLIFLNQIGVEFEKTGAITFKEEKFTKLLQDNYDAISEAITGEMGFAKQLSAVLSGYTRMQNGLLAVREQGLRSRVTKLDQEIGEKERRIDQKVQSLTDKFARLQGTLANMQRQQQAIAAMPGAGSGNMISQLLGG